MLWNDVSPVLTYETDLSDFEIYLDNLHDDVLIKILITEAPFYNYVLNRICMLYMFYLWL